MPHVVLSGIGIANKHCCINFNSDENQAMLLPNNEDNKKFPVKINGDLIIEPTRLKHGDRILIGSHYYYLYVDPKVDNKADCEWETAMKEANKDQMNLLGSDQEIDKQKAQLEEKLRVESEEKV